VGGFYYEGVNEFMGECFYPPFFILKILVKENIACPFISPIMRESFLKNDI
jgi:hypothetical protein